MYYKLPIKRVQTSPTHYRYEYPVDMTGVSVIRYAHDYTFCIIDKALPSATLVGELDAFPVSNITKLQLKKQAVEEGFWTELKTAIESDPEIKEDFDFALDLYINDPYVQEIRIAIGKTVEDMQTFFNNASQK